jgi:hypothetical protein
MSIKIERSRLYIAVLSVILYFLFSYSLENIIQLGYYEFVKFDRGEPEFLVLLLSYLIPFFLTVVLAVLPNSTFIYTIQYFVLIVIIYPASILLTQLNTDVRIIILNTVYFFAIYFVGNFFPLRFRTAILRENQKVLLLFFLSIALIAPFVVIFGSHLDLGNLLLSNIYESRELETELSNMYTGYFYTPLSNIIIPLLLLLAILHKHFFKAILAFGMLMFMFLVGGHKLVFFGTFAIVLFYYGSYYQKILVFLGGTIALMFLSIISYHVWNDFLLTAIVPRRIFFLPALLEVGYFDFFGDNAIYWSDSVLRGITEYPYTISTRNLVGRHVLTNVATNANNGIVSDGFMNFGVAGSLLNIFFVSVIYGILNTLNISQRFFGLIFLLFFTFYSSYFFTSMLTHGGILLLVVAYFFLKDTRTSYGD